MKESTKLSMVSRSTVVYENLKKKIITGELVPNTPLTEESLAEEFQVSRTPVREVIRKLEQDGLVEVIPRNGTYVKGLTINDIQELFTIRESLEGISARNACELINEQNITFLQTLLTKSDEELEKGNIEGALKMDELHNIILKISGNKRILNIISNLNSHIQRLHFLSVAIPGRLEKSNKEHWEIFYAIQKKDSEMAEKKMRQHIQSTRDSIIMAAKNDLQGF
jgi:DNA-binding GntR family transcriptional regulator